MAWYAIFFVLVVSAAGSVLPGNREKAASYCDVTKCKLPDCLCSSLEIPGGLSPAETPQVLSQYFQK
jgi:hypothetical protein